MVAFVNRNTISKCEAMAKEVGNLVNLELPETVTKVGVSFLQASDCMGKHARRKFKTQLFQTRVVGLFKNS